MSSSINPNLTLFDFEKPLEALYKKVSVLQKKKPVEKVLKDLSALNDEIQSLTSDIYKNVSNWDLTQIARHPNRPYALDYIERIFTDFVILHGDRNFGDDQSTVCGIANFDGRSVVIVAQQKGRNTEENVLRNFGMPKPEGYRKAMRFFEFAKKFKKPIITFIDTPGAYPGIESEERSQGEAIARNLKVMAGLTVPVISIVIGEGGSGGALGIGVANHVLMMQNSVYSVISPESCASILWRNANEKEKAANVLKNDAKTALKFNIIDEIIPEPNGGAHRDWDLTAQNMQKYLKKAILKYSKMSPTELIDHRIDKYSKMGAIKTL